MSAKGKAYAADSFKLGPSIGAALAVLGADNALPLLYGPHGCASTGSALLARHFRCTMPLHTVAMNEISVINGRHDDLCTAVADMSREHPDAAIGIIASAVLQTRGEYGGQIDWDTQNGRQTRAAKTVYIPVSDFSGTLEDGWAQGTTCLIEAFVPPPCEISDDCVAVLPSCHSTVGDIDALREILAAFGLRGVVMPDTGVAMTKARKRNDAKRNNAKRNGETDGLETLSNLSRCMHAIVIGQSMRAPAEALQSCTGMAYTIFDGLSGLAATDRLIDLLKNLSGRTVPQTLCRQRRALCALLRQAHPVLSKCSIVLAGDPDHVLAQIDWLAETGADLRAALCTHLPAATHFLRSVPAAEGDCADLAAAAKGTDLIVGPSLMRGYGEALNIPLWECGLPIIDRIDAPYRVGIGYRGSYRNIVEICSRLNAA